MKFPITFDDLKEETFERIRGQLKGELEGEIEDAVRISMMDREIAEAEVIDDYLNRHNFTFIIDI